MLTLILSDLHLGSRNCQAAALSRLLQTRFDRLILNGDVVNSLNLKKIKPKHWEVVSQLRDLARKRELILIRGNHDGDAHDDLAFGPPQVLATLLGTELHEEYSVQVDGRRYLVLHGDRFDPTLNWPIITDTADWCYQTTQKFNRKAARWLKHRAKKLGGVVPIVKRRSVLYARDLGYEGVVAGHTHFCADEWIEGMHYLNSGCWVDNPCTYLSLQDDQIRLCHWHEPAVVLREEPAAPAPADHAVVLAG